jgi:hypothetical protein
MDCTVAGQNLRPPVERSQAGVAIGCRNSLGRFEECHGEINIGYICAGPDSIGID